MRALAAWLADAGIDEGPVFRSVNRHRHLGAVLSGRDVARIVKQTAETAGFDTRNLAGHSLRSGLATAAAKERKPAHKIMAQTRHRSMSMLNQYIRDAELFVDNAADGLL